MNKSKIVSFELIDHGIDGSQYFQGCGVSHTEFAHVATGCGSNTTEAFDDALEQIAQSHDSLDLAAIEQSKEYKTAQTKRVQKFDVHAYLVRSKQIKRGEDMPDDCELYYYLSIRYNIGASDEVAEMSAGLHVSQTGFARK